MATIATEHTPTTRLTGDLGVFHIAAMVIATASPLGVMGGVAAFAMSFGNGYGVSGTYLLMTVLMLVFAYALGKMAPAVRNAGAFFSFVGRGLGAHAGVATAAIAWLVYYSVLTLVYAYVGVQVDAVVQMMHGPAIDWWIYTFVLMIVISLMGYRRIDLTTKVLSVTLTLEVLLILVVDVAVVAQDGVDGLHFEGFTPAVIVPNGAGFAIAAMFCAMSFIGFEATTVFRDEARDPDRTVPRATYIAVVFIGLLYSFSSWALSMAYDSAGLATAGAQGSPVLLGAATEFVGKFLADVIQVLLVTALFATALSFHNVLARYAHTLGRGHLLPTRVSEVHPRHRAPSVASTVITALSVLTFVGAVAVGLDPITDIVAWGNGISGLGFFVLLTITTVAVLVFLLRNRETVKVSLAGYLVVGAGAVAFAVLAWVAISNFSALAGGDGTLAFILIGLLPLGAVIAMVRATILKRQSPHRYAAMRELISSADDAHRSSYGDNS